MAAEKTLKVQKIEAGTVIDHISGGRAWEVVNLLGLDNYPDTVTVLSNVHSKTKGKKDVIKVENKELNKDEVNRIALVSPGASVNIVKDFEVKEKYNVELTKEIIDILSCTNPLCVTHVEPVKTRFSVESKDPLELKCEYCERVQRGLQFKQCA
jgi:aspartate carbamoyltransferase regulatory subunit